MNSTFKQRNWQSKFTDKQTICSIPPISLHSIKHLKVWDTKIKYMKYAILTHEMLGFDNFKAVFWQIEVGFGNVVVGFR